MTIVIIYLFGDSLICFLFQTGASGGTEQAPAIDAKQATANAKPVPAIDASKLPWKERTPIYLSEEDKTETSGYLLHQIMETLPDADRICLTLYDIDQMEIQSIAQLLNIPARNVRRILIRGRKKIYRRLNFLQCGGLDLQGLDVRSYYYQLINDWLDIEFMPDQELCNTVLSSCCSSGTGTDPPA